MRDVAAGIPRLHLDSAGGGPTLVMLHGWAMHGGVFRPLASALAQRFAVRVADLPGHGRSDPVAPFTLDSIVDRLEAAFAPAGEPLTVLGWSFGAIVALRWARRHPARVARLVLCGATPKFVRDDGWPHGIAAETLRRFADELAVAYRPTLQRFLALQVNGSAEGRATLAMLRAELFARGEPSPRVLAEALNILFEADVRDEVPSIDAPALVVAGERDTLAPAAAGQWLARALPRGDYASIASAGHAPFLSHRAQFAAALAGFVGHG